jgi:hypothetical protein
VLKKKVVVLKNLEEAKFSLLSEKVLAKIWGNKKDGIWEKYI